TVVEKLFREDEKVNLLASGQEWLGQPFNPHDQFSYVHLLNGLDAAQPVKYTMRVGAQSDGYSTFTVEEGTRQLAFVGIPSTVVGDYYSYQFITSVVTQQLVPNFTDGRTRLRFTYNSFSPSGAGYIDWYEIFWQRILGAENDLFAFNAQDTTALAEYN